MELARYYACPSQHNDFLRGNFLTQTQQGIVGTYEKLQLPNIFLTNNLIYTGGFFVMYKTFPYFSGLAPGRHAVWTSPSFRDVTVWRLRNCTAKKLNHGTGEGACKSRW